MKTSHAIAFFAGVTASGTIVAVGCGSTTKSGFEEPDAAVNGSISPGFNPDAAGGCVGLQCQQKTCSGGGATTVTGTVFAPNGRLPLYNAIVYVPNAPVAPMVKGASCEKCGAVTGSPLVTTLSGPTGAFTLKNVPAGTNIPLVIQVGKWRRQVTIPVVNECTENKLSDPELTRLPKNQTEGNIPQIALTTGGCDNLGCTLPKVGIDDSEFGREADGPAKAVHVYNGSGGQGPGEQNNAKAFWSNAATLKKYDMLILSCECSEHQENKGPVAFAAMTEYLEAGGRIFTTDLMYTWYRDTPNATFKSATNIRGGAPGGGSPMMLDGTFPKGKALNEWFETVSPGSNGRVTPNQVFSNIVSNDPAKSQQWARSGSPDGPRVVSVNVPVGKPADQQCGKGVHIDAHLNLGLGTGDKVDATYPKSCTTPLKDGEKLLAFFFFDLASCIQNEVEPPSPPR